MAGSGTPRSRCAATTRPRSAGRWRRGPTPSPASPGVPTGTATNLDCRRPYAAFIRSALAARGTRPIADPEPRFQHADLARGLSVTRRRGAHVAEVTERVRVAAEHALDPAEVEPRGDRARRALDRAIERSPGRR